MGTNSYPCGYVNGTVTRVRANCSDDVTCEEAEFRLTVSNADREIWLIFCSDEARSDTYIWHVVVVTIYRVMSITL